MFERARLVAVDVVAELTPLGEPEEYVDLSPTTGPVPMMVPARSLTSASDPATVDAAPMPPTPRTTRTPSTTTARRGPNADTDAEIDADAGDADVAEHRRSDDRAANRPAVNAGRPTDERTDAAGRRPVENAERRIVGQRGRAVPRQGRRPRPIPTPERCSPACGPARPTHAGDGGADAGGTAETIFDRRDAALVPLIVAAARKLKRVLADEQNDVLDALRKKPAVTDLTAILPSDSDHTNRYADAIGDDLLAAAVAGAGTTGDASPSALRSSIAKSTTLEPVRAAIAADLVGPLRDRLGRCVADGAGDNDDITKRVRAVYREWKTQHIDDQLDDVFRLAYGAGALAAATPGTRLCWAVDPHGPACPDAEDNALAGPVEAGDAYPTGHTMAPAHAGCRCLLVPASN